MLIPVTHDIRQLKCLLVGFAAVLTTGGSAAASPIFTQATTNTEVFDGASGSDRDAIFGNGQQMADDFTVGSSATIQSVTWWGIYNNPIKEGSLQQPWDFEIFIYGDNGGLPDTSKVIGSSQVSFNSLTDTGENFADNPFGDDIYVFTADVTPINLSAGTTYWFSVLADTSNDAINNFSWRYAEGGNAVRRTGENGTFTDPFSADNGVMLFILNGVLIPEPQPPLISRIEFVDGQIEVEFSGILQKSDILLRWDDLTPQPISPYRFTPSQEKMFFRARTE
jgi:hypothetical protein